MITSYFFYLFSIITCFAGLMVVISKNPVHSVLFLILTFFNSAGLFILLNAEFLAMMLVVVYVGAVAVLFLFVVMMLDVDFVKLRDGFKKYRTIGFLVGSILIAELFLVFFNSSKLNKKVIKLDNLNNTKELGKIIYTDNIYLFQLSGLILLVAMIGAITLTMRRRPGVKKQLISNQNDRKREATVRLVKVKSEKNN